MNISRLLKTVSFLILLNSFAVLSAPSENEKLHISGYARVVLGYLDEPNAEYIGYDNSVSIDQQSLIGLQASYQFSDYLSATGQFIGRTGKQTSSELDRLYLTYSPTKFLQFKVGRQRTPIYMYSDILDVGFAYPWITLPQQVYPPFLFPSFDGILASYEYVGKEAIINVEGYWGSFKREFTNDGTTFNVDMENLMGAIGNLSYRNWLFRVSYHRANIDIGLVEFIDFRQQLEQIGFPQSADSIVTTALGSLYQLSAEYENIDYFFRTELTYLETDLIISPDTKSYLISGGYNFQPFSVYTSFAKNINRYNLPVNEIPVGINPQLDALAFGYQQVFQQLTDDSSKSYTVGIRWDWKHNVAFKTEATLIDADEGSRGFVITQPQSAFDGKATFYQAAMEWVF